MNGGVDGGGVGECQTTKINKRGDPNKRGMRDDKGEMNNRYGDIYNEALMIDVQVVRGRCLI